MLPKAKLVSYCFTLLKVFVQTYHIVAVMVQSIRAFFSNPEYWLFECQPRKTFKLVVKAGSDSSPAKCSTIGVSVTSPQR